jgi:hypothetical protein
MFAVVRLGWCQLWSGASENLAAYSSRATTSLRGCVGEALSEVVEGSFGELVDQRPSPEGPRPVLGITQPEQIRAASML